MLEYQGTNSSTRRWTEGRQAVEAAASRERYGRSLPSAQGTSVPSPTSATGGPVMRRALRYPSPVRAGDRVPGRHGTRNSASASEQHDRSGCHHEVRLAVGEAHLGATASTDN